MVIVITNVQQQAFTKFIFQKVIDVQHYRLIHRGKNILQ